VKQADSLRNLHRDATKDSAPQVREAVTRARSTCAWRREYAPSDRQLIPDEDCKQNSLDSAAPRVCVTLVNGARMTEFESDESRHRFAREEDVY